MSRKRTFANPKGEEKSPNPWWVLLALLVTGWWVLPALLIGIILISDAIDAWRERRRVADAKAAFEASRHG